MRWTKPKDGDVKVKKKFAIIPVTIKDEIRWFEWITVKYRYYNRISVWNHHECCYKFGWYPREFVDEKEAGRLCHNCDGRKHLPVKDNIGIAAQYQCPECGRLWYENEDE